MIGLSGKSFIQYDPTDKLKTAIDFTYEFLYNKFFFHFQHSTGNASRVDFSRSHISMDVRISKRAGIAVQTTGVPHGNGEMYLTVINLL